MGRSRQAMKTVRLRPHLGILFVLAVGLPSAALVVIAVRSIAGEEAVLEKRLERTLGAELDHVVTLVADAMDGRTGGARPGGARGHGRPRPGFPQGVEGVLGPRGGAVPAHGRRPAGRAGEEPRSERRRAGLSLLQRGVPRGQRPDSRVPQRRRGVPAGDPRRDDGRCGRRCGCRCRTRGARPEPLAKSRARRRYRRRRTSPWPMLLRAGWRSGRPPRQLRIPRRLQRRDRSPLRRRHLPRRRPHPPWR